MVFMAMFFCNLDKRDVRHNGRRSIVFIGLFFVRIGKHIYGLKHLSVLGFAYICHTYVWDAA